ncbi:MAG: LysM peptidoglycan-binding domain-containing protein [Syntrophaceae bacterium]|nr:LysM peptidoglycan-binding domain-containing protein [Syntrophaceae bacterium]
MICIGILALFYLFCLPCAEAKEDTALLSFQKVLPAEKLGNSYTIRAGDTIYGILKKRMGLLSVKTRKEAIDMIKKLNPQLSDLSKIYPGQVIILPENVPLSTKDQFGVETVFYKVKRGDSLEKILMSQLNIKRVNMTRMINTIQEMNPKITNPDHIMVNQMLRLPSSSPTEPAESSLAIEETDADRDPGKPIVVSETLQRNLLVAGQIFSRMNGAMITDGQYYLPLAEYGQLALDCASMPMVEFDDGSIVFIELRSRLPLRIKKLVKNNWPNYGFIPIGEMDDILSIAQKVVNQSIGYQMKKGGQYNVGEKPTVSLSPDWSIGPKSNKVTDTHDSGIGLLFRKNADQCLPSYLAKNLSARGIKLVEVIKDFGIAAEKNDNQEPLPVPNISGLSKTDMIHNLLTLLDEEAVKDAEINLYDQDRGGFDLTMRADIVLKTDKGRTIISFGRIPQEFASMLKKEGYNILPLKETDTKIKLITKVLTYLKIGHTFNYFRLTVNHVNDPDVPFVSAIFPALQIYEPDRFLHYLVDFPFDPVFFTYFKHLKEVSIVEY